MNATHEVVRAFPGPEGILAAVTRVDASTWRNREKLVEQRRLRPITSPGLSPATVAEASEPSSRRGKGR